MRFNFKITKKLSIQIFASKFRASFKFIEIVYDRFIDYSFYVTIFNVGLRVYYINEKQQKALQKLHEALGDMEE